MDALAQRKVSANDLMVVLALVRTGTLAAAGLQLAVDGSTVFRSVQRLEKSLHQRLFERSRAGYQATELGLQLAQHAERIEVELEAARGATDGQNTGVSGSVRISTTDTLLHGLVMPALRSLGAAHAGLHFELTASNELASLSKRDADIAVRATTRPPEHLVGKHLGPIRVAVYGARHQPFGPGAIAEGALSPWIGPDDSMPEHPSVLWRKRHQPQALLQYKVNSILSVMEAIAAGLGVGIVPLFLARGREDLVALSEPLDECETQLWLLTHPESRHLRRISTVAAHLAAHLRLA
jgi:DNA-binding transcriptional LysR family regulator